MKVLFQGDSVTDAGRDRCNPHDMGEGYPKYAAAMLTDTFSDRVDFEFLNLGISGNRTENLVQRLENDFVEIQPDLLILMIGVNDVWHHYSFNYETPIDYFENNLRTVLSAVKSQTKARIMLIEPFILNAPDKENMLPELDEKIRVERKLAREFADVYLPLHAIFTAETIRKDYHDYSADGVHPSQEGACFIGEQILHALTPLLEDMLAEAEV